MSSDEPTNTQIERSGGIDLQADKIHIGGDVVGRDKNVTYTVYGATINTTTQEPIIRRRDANPQPPRPPLDFFDRTTELAQVTTLIQQGKPTVIYGADGSGKSALLRQAANRAEARALPDGVLLLEGLDEHGYTLLSGDVVQRWFDAFYLSEPQLQVTSASAQPYLNQLRPLLLIDHATLEADQLRPLLDLFPNSPAVIARPSALPGLARPIKLGVLPRADAIELFAATSGLFIDDTNQPQAAAICALLNDVPLAIVRAADVVREMDLPLDQAQARLAAAPAAQGDAVAGGLSRAAVFIRSVLTPLEQRVLIVAAGLPGTSIDPPRLAELAGADEPTVLTAVDHLKALGLLHANSPRVRMDAGLRDLWRDAASTNEVNNRLLTQLLNDEQQGKFATDAFCADELGHVLGAIEHATQTQRWADAITLSRAIDRYLTLHGLWDAWGQIADRVLQSARALNDRSSEAWALHQLGTRAIAADQTQAIALLQQALTLRRALGDRGAIAITQHNLNVLLPPPPPPPPSGGEQAIGSGGLSGTLKALLAILVIGAIGTGAFLLLRSGNQPVATPMAQVSPTARQADTPTIKPLSATPTSTATQRPSRTPTQTPSHTPTHTPTGTTAPTQTFTPTPTPTAILTPAPALPLVVERNGRYEVVMTDGNGEQQLPLTEKFPNGAYDPVLSPDGQFVAFWTFTNNTNVPSQRELYAMNVNNREPRFLWSASPVDTSHIVWSPNSDRVAVTLVDPETQNTDIWIVPLAGAKPQRLTSPQFDDFPVHTDPAFSPDGSEIAFVPRNRDFASAGISISGVDGANYRRILDANTNNLPVNIAQLAWQPFGDRLSFVAVPNTSRFSTALPRPQIALINSDGSNLQAVTDSQFARFDNSAWSPTGKQLAFIAENAVWVMAADGSVLRPIVRSLRQEPNGCTFEAMLVWLPEGDRVAYNTDRSGPIEVHTISDDGRIDLRLPLDPLSYLRLPRGCALF